MTRATPSPSPTPTRAATPAAPTALPELATRAAPPELASLLDQLEAVLTRQISHAGRGDYDAVLAEADHADDLLRQATEALAGACSGAERPRPDGAPGRGRAPDARQQQRLQRIFELHRRLRLKLALQRAETGERLGRFRTGRKVVRAYEGAPGA